MGKELLMIGLMMSPAAALAYSIYQGVNTKTEKMKPTSFDDFGMTKTQEGLAVPIIYGRVKTAGNIIWYGDLKTKKIKSKGGGKGMGDNASQGYRYYVSCWQAISYGKINIVKTYVNSKDDEEIQATNTIWNDGTMATYPSNVPKANKLKGIAHIYWERWYIGENVNSIPNVQFVVDRILPNTIENSNLSTGSNPAAVIYDLLILGGVQASEIDLPSFQLAADTWAASNTGLNLIFSEQKSVTEAIEEILK